MSDLILRNNDDVENIQHKHTPKPWGYSSWKEYWCDHSGEEWPETCRYRGCGENADGSAHVIVNDDEEYEYIIPMCNEHNSPAFSEVFSVNSGTCAVYIDKEEIQAELADNLTVQLGRLTLKSGMRVQNIRGTHACLPRGYGSWKKYYIGHDEREWPNTCRIGGCTEPAKGGAHVHKEGECSCVFIVPMCEIHNTPHKNDWLPVKKGTFLVPVDQGDTKGPAGICYRKKCR